MENSLEAWSTKCTVTVILEGNVWHIPAARIKEGATNGDNWVPLSDAALALLGTPKKSGRIVGDLPHDALDDKLKEYRSAEIATMHGFRTSFTGWAEKTAGHRAYGPARCITVARSAGHIAVNR